MFLVGIFQWWYGRGWLDHLRKSYNGILRTADFFSIGLLLKTLFSPFKQISAGAVQGALPVQLSAFFDRLFSRAVGGVIRSMAIVLGMIVILCRSILSLVSIVVWTLVPITPIFGVILWLTGVIW